MKQRAQNQTATTITLKSQSALWGICAIYASNIAKNLEVEAGFYLQA